MPIDYDKRSKDPGSWFSVGFTLHFAANVLWKRLRPALHAWQPAATLTDEQELALRLKGPFAMLAGMAIEVMLKGAIVQAMPPKQRTAPPQHHDLVALSDRANQAWSDDQRNLLRRLTTFVVWAGRYPVATSAKKSQEPRLLKSTDYQNIVEIASHLYKVHLGQTP
jgi:hypothetical protein